MGVQGRVVTARSRGQPAAERGELEGLREVPQRQAVRPQLALEARTEHPRLHAGRPAGAVDLEHPVETGQVEGDGGAVEARLDAARDAAPAAVRHHGEARSRAPVEHVDDVPLRQRPDHQVGHVLEPALEVADDVAERLAVRVCRPVDRVRRAAWRQRGGRPDPGRRETEGGRVRWRVVGEVVPGHQQPGPLDQRRRLVGRQRCFHVAPTPPGPCHEDLLCAPPVAVARSHGRPTGLDHRIPSFEASRMRVSVPPWHPDATSSSSPAAVLAAPARWGCSGPCGGPASPRTC